MAFSFFKISLFVLEIFTFLYYANEESDDVIYIGGSIKVHLTPILFLLLNNFRNLCSTVVKKILNLLKSTSF